MKNSRIDKMDSGKTEAPLTIYRRSQSESESELLLVTRSNDNHSPGPVMREVSP